MTGEVVRVVGVLTPTGRAYRLEGHLSTTIAQVCARCGTTFALPLATGFSLLYRHPGTASATAEPEVMVTAEDCALVNLDAAGRIDLADLVREQIYLGLP
ncbi:MAG: DUF177 domain-containing protein, partial [Acidobacteriota bacterium]